MRWQGGVGCAEEDEVMVQLQVAKVELGRWWQVCVVQLLGGSPETAARGVRTMQVSAAIVVGVCLWVVG